jgi:hypothetical protein
LVRSVRLAIAGAGILCASVALLLVLPRLSPFELLHCPPVAPAQPSREAAGCFSMINPLYPIVFLLSVAGTAVIFLGAFGRSFIVSPVFVAGMIALEYGLSGVVSGALDGERAASIDPAVFAPLVAIGALALGFQTYRRLRRSTS